MTAKTFTGYNLAGATPASSDVFLGLDVSDTTDHANGTVKRFTSAEIIDAVEANANTFTAANKFSLSTDADHPLYLTNVNAGTAATASLYVSNDGTGAGSAFVTVGGTGLTPAGGFLADAGVFGSGANLSGGLVVMSRAGPIAFYANGHLNEVVRIETDGALSIVDGMTAPSATSGWAKIFVDSADGDLKVIFGDGTTKTIVVDT